MKLARRLLSLVEVLFLAAIMYFVYTLFCGATGNEVVSTLDKEMPGVMQVGRSSGLKCEDTGCLDLLSEEERIQYDTCYNRSVSAKYVEKFGPISAGTCHFQSGGARFSVGLGSFQGSGNTWLRGLLQKVTGICTGSLYCDGALRTKGFTGEGVHGESVIAIKSHTVNPLFTNMKSLPKSIPSKTPVFGAALVLIRNPRGAMIAEWHRERTKRQTTRNVSNHVLFVGEEYFGENPDWHRFVTKMTDRWKRHVYGWLSNGRNNPLCVVKFEELQDHTPKEMLRIISFYGGTKMSYKEISAKINTGYNTFHRNHTDTFRHFTDTQETYVEDAIQEVINELTKHYALDSYIIKILQSYM